jgi:hypothetical protein
MACLAASIAMDTCTAQTEGFACQATLRQALQAASCSQLIIYFVYVWQPQPEVMGHTRSRLQPESRGRYYAQSAALTTGN